MGTTPKGKAIDAQYLLDQLKNFDSKVLANKYGITKTVKNDFTVYADGSSPDPDLKVRNGRVDILKTDATDTTSAWSSLFMTKAELQSGDAANVLSHKFYTKNFMINDAKTTVLQYNASDNTFFIEKSNWSFSGGDNKDFEVLQAKDIILEIGSGSGKLTIPNMTQAIGQGLESSAIYGPNEKEVLGFGENAIGLGWRKDSATGFTPNFHYDDLRVGVILEATGEAKLEGTARINLHLNGEPVFESEGTQTKIRVEPPAAKSEQIGFVRIDNNVTDGSSIFLNAQKIKFGHGVKAEAEYATLTYDHSKGIITSDKTVATDEILTDVIGTTRENGTIVVSGNLELYSNNSLFVDHIYDTDEGDQSAELMLAGGSTSSQITLNAAGEENSATIDMKGSSSSGDYIKMTADSISFQLDSNLIKMPTDKAGTVALLSDITAATEAVKYETDSISDTMDMKSEENDEGERTSKAAHFGSFDTNVGKKIGMNSDGVYIYMPWDGKSQSYGHIIAADDDDGGDASLFHTALTGDEDDDVPAFRRVLDSVNFSDYISTGYKATSNPGCSIPGTGSDASTLCRQYFQTMTGYSYIKINNFVHMVLTVPRLKTWAGDAYGYYTLPFSFKRGRASAIVPNPKYAKRTVLGADCDRADWSTEIFGNTIGFYAPEDSSESEYQDYGFTHSRGWKYTLNSDGWDTIIIEGELN